MVHDGCWSTVICTGGERAALGNTSDTGWVLGCRLSIGHLGDHATDAETIPRFDRRLWLEWNDHDQHAQSLIDRNPCSAAGHCMLFEGHGGVHWYAPTNGHAPSVGGGRRHVGGPDSTGSGTTTTVDRDDTGSRSRDLGASGEFPAGDLPLSDPRPVDFPGEDHPTGDIPNLRGRAVRTPPDVDAFRPDEPTASVPDVNRFDDDLIARGGSHRGESSIDTDRSRADSVSDALDDVVVALSRLAQALRSERAYRTGSPPAI